MNFVILLYTKSSTLFIYLVDVNVFLSRLICDITPVFWLDRKTHFLLSHFICDSTRQYHNDNVDSNERHHRRQRKNYRTHEIRTL